ncbi:MAG: DOMON-like domain-containing protein [Burkholderiales bacterium]
MRRIAARVSRTPGKLSVSYVLSGDLKRLCVPAPQAPRVADRLWEHTCCEIFVACKGLPAYYEFNLSPSGEWAAYAFNSYRAERAGGMRADGLAPQVNVRGTARVLELDAVIRLDALSAVHSSAPLSLALSAVVEDNDGDLSYWALRHPPGRPDFHHAEAFALHLSSATPPAREGTPSGQPPEAAGARRLEGAQAPSSKPRRRPRAGGAG